MSREVLVLNASYEPLSHVSWEKAVRLVFKGKAYVHESVEGKYIHHKGEPIMEWPKTVILSKYATIPYIYGPTPFSKHGVLKRDNYTCAYCLGKADTVEHILPQSTHPELARDWENCVAACFDCNNKKQDKPLSATGMKLLIQPYTPHGVRRR